MNEEQRERAALYALGLLDADEAAAFEREAAADGELRTLADELRETAASLARMETNAAPPPELKSRVLAHVADENYDYPAAGKVIAGPWARWQPRAAVAILFIFCAGLVWAVIDQQTRYRKAVGIAERAVLQSYSSEQQLREAQADRLQQIAFCALEPVPAPPQTGPQAAVLWDAARRRGQLRVSKLPPAGEGKDYQLWMVESGRKDPVSAGVVKVGTDGGAEIEFQAQDDGQPPVAAFALSLERAGGAPKNEGPILYLGKL